MNKNLFKISFFIQCSELPVKLSFVIFSRNVQKLEFFAKSFHSKKDEFCGEKERNEKRISIITRDTYK